MNKKVYLDYAATTPVHSGVFEAMETVSITEFGNPSAQHSFGQRAQELVDNSRSIIAKFIHTKSENIVFTSGATESNNLGILGRAQGLEAGHIIISDIEHPSVTETAQKLAEAGWGVSVVPVNSDAVVDLDTLKQLLKPNTSIVSIMYVNNEVGSIQPVETIKNIIRDYEKANNTKIFFHVDAVQAGPYLDIDVEKLDCNGLTLSGHKIYGPKGIGVLYLKDYKQIKPLLAGGGQEHGLKSGTLNTPGIVGLAEAIKFVQSSEYKSKLETNIDLREKLIAGIKNIYPQAIWHGEKNNLTPNHLYFSLVGISNESLLILLDQSGIAISAGSACSSGAIKKSHIAGAMGLADDVTNSVMRCTLGFYTTQVEIDYFLEKLETAIKQFKTK